MATEQWVGRDVIVRNPNLPAAWRGKVMAYIDQPTFLIETADGERLALPAAWAEIDRPGQITSFFGVRLNTRWIEKAKGSERLVKVVDFSPKYGWRMRDGRRARVELPGEYDIVVNVLRSRSGNAPRGTQGTTNWHYDAAEFVKKFREANE